MRTKMIQWLDTQVKQGPRHTNVKMRVMFGVQILSEGRWMHAHRNGKPLIFSTEARAQAERKKLRALPAA